MKGVLPDNNVVGHVRLLIRILESGPLAELWNGLALRMESLRVSRRLMEILFDIDKVRGAGRLFAP